MTPSFPRPFVLPLLLSACGGASGGGGTAHLAFPLRDLALGHEDACVVDAHGDVACWGEGGFFPGMQAYAGEHNDCVEPFVPDFQNGGVFGDCVTDGPLWIETPPGERFVDASVRLRALALTDGGRLVGFPWIPEDCVPPCSDAEVISGEVQLADFDLFDVGWCGVTTTGEGVCARIYQEYASVVPKVGALLPIPGGHVFTSISTSAFDYVALDADGVAWRGQLSMAFDPVEELVVYEPTRWTDRTFTQVEVGTRYYASFVAGPQNVGPTPVCGLEEGTGAVWCDGPNEYGERGVGRIEPLGAESAASPVIDLPKADEIAVAVTHACARSGGDVWCWGLNSVGQLGAAAPEWCEAPGLTDPWACSSRPVKAAVSGARRIDAGIAYTCAETDDDVLCWGLGEKGRLGSPGPSSQEPVSVVHGR